MEIDLSLQHQLIHLELFLLYMIGNKLSNYFIFPNMKNRSNSESEIQIVEQLKKIGVFSNFEHSIRFSGW